MLNIFILHTVCRGHTAVLVQSQTLVICLACVYLTVFPRSPGYLLSTHGLRVHLNPSSILCPFEKQMAHSRVKDCELHFAKGISQNHMVILGSKHSLLKRVELIVSILFPPLHIESIDYQILIS